MQYLQCPAEDAVSSGVGDTGGCKLPNTGAGNPAARRLLPTICNTMESFSEFSFVSLFQAYCTFSLCKMVLHLFFYLFTWGRGHLHQGSHGWRAEDSWQESALSFRCVGRGNAGPQTSQQHLTPEPSLRLPFLLSWVIPVEDFCPLVHWGPKLWAIDALWHGTRISLKQCDSYRLFCNMSESVPIGLSAWMEISMSAISYM